MIEQVFKAVELAAKGIEKMKDIEMPKVMLEEAPSDEVIESRAKLSAKNACDFFSIPDAIIQEGDNICVYNNNLETLSDDVFQYNINQFKEMDCTSFEDMTKVWSHECGHRLLQHYYPNSWTHELGGDFFTGVRAEMIGLPKGNFEKHLGTTSASVTHPDGKLRLQAIDYGRQTVAKMRENGIKPTWENCIKAFDESPFSKMKEKTSEGNCAISFTGDNIENIKREITSKEKELRTASHNVDYWSKEINNFNSKTSDTHRRKCENGLERESQKCRDLERDLSALKQKLESMN